MWRDGQKAVHAFVAIRETAGWPNSEMMAQQVGPLDMPEVQEEIQRLSDAAADINVVQKELQEVFFNFVHFSDLPCPSQRIPICWNQRVGGRSGGSSRCSTT